jgi:hypothetical protein
MERGVANRGDTGGTGTFRRTKRIAPRLIRSAALALSAKRHFVRSNILAILPIIGQLLFVAPLFIDRFPGRVIWSGPPLPVENDMPTVTPMRADDFLNTIGVNTHIPYTDGGYANIGNVTADLAYLGVNQVRDTISNGYAGSAPLSSYVTLAQQGIQFTILSFSGGAQTAATLQAQLSLITQLQRAVPGSVIAIEGANEINNFAISYNGVGGLQGAINLQRALYSAVHGSSALAGVAVDYFTGYNAGGIGVGPNPATTAGLADYDTQHPYPPGAQAPGPWVSRGQALQNENPPTGPAVYTETGYSTNGGTDGAVNADVQAKYTLDLLLDAAQQGIAHTYLYQLMDAYQPGSPQGDDGFGLFDPNNQPKEAATAIHDLTTILADPGINASHFTPTPVSYWLSNLPTTGNSSIFQKSNGATDIVVWNEPQIWNETTGTEVAAPSTPVNVAFGAQYQTVRIFDPLIGTAPIQTLYNAASANISVTDHPLIVELEPQSAGPDTLTLRMSEDAWNGNAQFLVSVDGAQVGGVQTAAVLHSSGESGVFNLTGSWGSGPHSVQIQFINDAYGGSTSTDRNLYVDSIAYDGVTYAGTSLKIGKNGTVAFPIGGTVPVADPPPDTLTLHLSESAWMQDAQFTLGIDGRQVSMPQSVTASHAAGVWQDFVFAGTFGAGSHSVAISFVNDAFGGTASTDRNLFINGIDINGQHYGTGVTELATNSTATFVITTAQ